MAYIFDLSDAWTNGATTFTAIKMSVTDTASASGSLLMDLQVGGVSKFRVTKAGDISLNPTGFSGPYTLQIGDAGSLQVYGTAFGSQPLYVNYSGGLSIANNTGSLRFGLSSDVQLFRDAANTLAQRNSTNPQAFNLYNTYTDASNYERGFMRWSANTFEIGTGAAGTGTSRQTWLYGGGSAAMILSGADVIFYQTPRSASDGTVSLGATTHAWNNVFTAGFHEAREMTAPAAPAANGVRIYAEDNGSGKTRLMALFPTGVAQQIAIEP